MSGVPQKNGFVSLNRPDARTLDSIITLAGLADGAARRSSAFDGLTTAEPMPQDFHVYVELTASGTGPTESDRACYVYLMAKPGDNAAITSWPDGGDGQDGATTVTRPTNLIRLGIVRMPQRGVTYQEGPYSLAAVCGGMYPAKMSIVVENRTGFALSSTASENGLVVNSYRTTMVNLDWFEAQGEET